MPLQPTQILPNICRTKIMAKHTEIRRFRISKEIAQILDKQNLSSYVRKAIENQMIRDKLIKKPKTPF